MLNRFPPLAESDHTRHSEPGCGASTGKESITRKTRRQAAGESPRTDFENRVAVAATLPRAPLYVWLRGETEGRLTEVEY